MKYINVASRTRYPCRKHDPQSRVPLAQRNTDKVFVVVVISNFTQISRMRM